MLNKDNYVPWSSRIIRYARSRTNGKLIVDSIENGPYVRRMIATPGELDLPVLVPKTFHEQTEEELTENDIKWMDADDQAIQTILLGLPEDVYAAVDSCEAAKEIWERIQLQAEEFDFMATAGDLDEIEEVNTNCILMENLQHASTSGTQLDKAPVYDIYGSAENNNHVTYVTSSMVQSGGTVETSSAPNKETGAHQEIVYRNLIDQVAQQSLYNGNLLLEEHDPPAVYDSEETLELAQESREK
nr:hypothetical protein [Tanacetum cinerariifolium]